ncbi:MAG: alpha-E domain-containing protein [Rhodospirillales bacterium]|nr:alpha-E domain-containing protein [Rhodospirillales bacterium]
MLGRTANNVYWMARFVERAENMARLLASTYHMSLLPVASGNDAQQWEAPLKLAGDRETFLERYGETSPGSVLQYMVLDADNAASIRSAVRQARENARATRPELTTEVWEGINQTFIEMESLSYSKMVDQGFREFFDWVKERSHLFRGAIYGTMRRGDAFTFSRLGTFIERADNTARFLSIKWEMLTPSTGGRPLAAEDYYRWGALLRALSAFKAYREVYTGIIEPRRVAELLVLRQDMPRSLAACTGETDEILRELRANAACTRLATQIHDGLQRHRIDSILRSGLPRFLNGFVGRNNELHSLIGKEFMLVL